MFVPLHLLSRTNVHASANLGSHPRATVVPPGMEAKADIAQHSTTLMAGAFAADVAARMLVLTHFSAR